MANCSSARGASKDDVLRTPYSTVVVTTRSYSSPTVHWSRIISEITGESPVTTMTEG